ncbi:cytidine deaminase [Robertkochia flava]|uniref:cytidine deaminase n=1 Tax=Robertkochia flava TaxID=3447986 RepID=UPI001CCE101E|nr:cytidine deaminase [Robertkochia marina]
MKKIEIKSTLTVYSGVDELPAEVTALMAHAVRSRAMAYAPYSRFQVGAALLLDNGEVVCGNNQENAAFPSGLCAERVAVFHAGATFPDAVIKAVAICAASLDFRVKDAVAPCGACRQALAEYEYRQKSPVAVYFMGDNTEVYHSPSVRELLPLVFTEKSLLQK